MIVSRNQKERPSFLACLLILLFGTTTLAASDWSIPVGIVMEHNFYTQFGITASVSNTNILGGHPQGSISITSSRLSAIFGYNVLKKENLLFSAAWHFRPGTYIDPYAGLDFGCTWFDRENVVLFGPIQHVAPLFNVRTGIESSILGGRVCPAIDCGIAFVQSSTVFPLFFSVKFRYDLTKGWSR